MHLHSPRNIACTVHWVFFQTYQSFLELYLEDYDNYVLSKQYYAIRIICSIYHEIRSWKRSRNVFSVVLNNKYLNYHIEVNLNKIRKLILFVTMLIWAIWLVLRVKGLYHKNLYIWDMLHHDQGCIIQERKSCKESPNLCCINPSQTYRSNFFQKEIFWF